MSFPSAPSLVERLQFGFLRSLPMQRQTESAECGLACLSMIASYHGCKTDIASLRKQYPISQKAATLTQLVDIAAGMELAPRPISLELNELERLQLPCILHWNMDHFVVLRRCSGNKLTIHDPAKGVREYTLEEASSHFTGVALELSPAPGFRRRTERQRVSLRQLMGNVVGLKRSLTQIALLALALEAFSLIGPFFNQWVIDQAVVSGDRNLVITLAVGVGLVKVISVGVEALRGWATLVMSATLNLQWLANLFSHLLRLPIRYFEKRHMGDVVSRFNAIHAIQSTLTTSLMGALLDGIMAIGTLVMMLIYSPSLAAVAVAGILLYLLLRGAFYTSLMTATESAVAEDARQQSLFMETVRGIQSIRLFARESERGARWLNAVVDQKNAALRTQRLNLVFTTGNHLLMGLEGIIIMALGAYMVMDNIFSVGMLFAFISYKTQFSTRVSSLIDKIFELKMLRFHGERLADIALSDPERNDHSFSHELQSVSSDISVTDVSFRYGVGEKTVLSNISFDIRAGESVAIVGPSGCGKTTLMKILLGIHPPTRWCGSRSTRLAPPWQPRNNARWDASTGHWSAWAPRPCRHSPACFSRRSGTATGAN